MEVSINKNNCIKIKTNKAIVIIDPQTTGEDEDIILYVAGESRKKYLKSSKLDTLIIQGPGEYEKNEVSITGKDIKGEIMYEVSTDSVKLLVIPSTLIDEMEDESGFAGVLIQVISPVKDTIFSHTTGSLVMLYGEQDKILLKEESIKKTSKVNLKKKEEFEGTAVVLVS